jgi:hypothetical protein
MGTDILNPNHTFLPRVPLGLLGGERHIFAVEGRDFDPPYHSFDPLAGTGELLSVVSRNTADWLLLWIALLLRRGPQAVPACFRWAWAWLMLPGELIGNSNNFHKLARQVFDPLVDARVNLASVAVIQPATAKVANVVPLCRGRAAIVRRYICRVHMPRRLPGLRRVVLDYDRPGLRPKDSPVMSNPDRPSPGPEVHVITGRDAIPPYRGMPGA